MNKCNISTLKIILGVFIIIIFIYFIIYNYESGQYQRKNYPIINKSFSIKGIVIQKKRVINIFNRGVLIEISDGNKFNVPWLKNDLYEKDYLDDFIQVGDSVMKRIEHDSIFIFRNGSEYYFILE